MLFNLDFANNTISVVLKQKNVSDIFSNFFFLDNLEFFCAHFSFD